MKSSKFTTSFILISCAVFLVSCSGVEDSSQYKDLREEVNLLQKQVGNISDELQSFNNELETINTSTRQTQDNLVSVLEKIDAKLISSEIRKQIIDEIAYPACFKHSLERLKQIGITDSSDEGIENALAFLNRTERFWINLRGFWNEFTGKAKTYPATFPNLNAYMIEFKVWNFEPYYTCLAGVEDIGCKSVDKLLLKKNPNSYRGKCLTGTVEIIQLDANTGPCTFHGYINGGSAVRAQFGKTLDPATHQRNRDCPDPDWELLKEGQRKTFYAFGIGSYSYDTTMGGSQTIPAFRLIDLD
jgi:hypothetical protein